MVVIGNEFVDQIVQMVLSEDYELRQAFKLYRLDESFATTVEIR